MTTTSQPRASEGAHTYYGKLIALDLPLNVKATAEGPSIRDANGDRIAECYLESQAMEIRQAVNAFERHERELKRLRNSHAANLRRIEALEKALSGLLPHVRNGRGADGYESEFLEHLIKYGAQNSTDTATMQAVLNARAALQPGNTEGAS